MVHGNFMTNSTQLLFKLSGYLGFLGHRLFWQIKENDLLLFIIQYNLIIILIFNGEKIMSLKSADREPNNRTFIIDNYSRVAMLLYTRDPKNFPLTLPILYQEPEP